MAAKIIAFPITRAEPVVQPRRSKMLMRGVANLALYQQRRTADALERSSDIARLQKRLSFHEWCVSTDRQEIDQLVNGVKLFQHK
jgi:hypothetical protein